MPQIAMACICCGADIKDKHPAVLMPFVAKRALDWELCEITAEWGLRDLHPGHAYALGNTLHCHICGMVFLDMRFDDAEMARLYHGYRGEAYTALREHYEPGYRTRNERLVAGDGHIGQVEQLLRPWLPAQPAILDWGGDTGLNTPLRHQARLHHVFDISGQPAIDGAQSVSLAVLAQHRYDLIVLSNVLEHVPQPETVLAQIVPHLHDGLLYVEVPFEPLMRQAHAEPEVQVWSRKRHWHEHINFFSVKAMTRLLARCGLGVVKESLIELEGGGYQMALVARRLS